MDFQGLLTLTREMQITGRLLQLEERQKNRKGIQGKWEGVKSGVFESTNPDGTVTVTVEGKQYIARRKAFTSIPKGTIVSVTSAGGKYYASW